MLLLGGCTLVCDVSCGAPVPRTRVSVWPWHRRASGGRQGRGRDVRRDRVADRRTRARDRERAERSQETQSHAGGRKRSGAAVYYYYFVPACFPSGHRLVFLRASRDPAELLVSGGGGREFVKITVKSVCYEIHQPPQMNKSRFHVHEIAACDIMQPE